MDGWVGEDGPLVQSCLGGEEGGRVRVVDGVPHAFCLSTSDLSEAGTDWADWAAQANSELVAGIVARWMVPDTRSSDGMSDQRGRGGSTFSTAMPM